MLNNFFPEDVKSVILQYISKDDEEEFLGADPVWIEFYKTHIAANKSSSSSSQEEINPKTIVTEIRAFLRTKYNFNHAELMPAVSDYFYSCLPPASTLSLEMKLANLEANFEKNTKDPHVGREC
jgi:hypothetical protein